jgi:hypothetical protein
MTPSLKVVVTVWRTFPTTNSIKTKTSEPQYGVKVSKIKQLGIRYNFNPIRAPEPEFWEGVPRSIELIDDRHCSSSHCVGFTRFARI